MISFRIDWFGSVPGSILGTTDTKRKKTEPVFKDKVLYGGRCVAHKIVNGAVCAGTSPEASRS